MASAILDTGIKLVKNVNRYNFGRGSISELAGLVDARRLQAAESGREPRVVFFVDEFFRGQNALSSRIAMSERDRLVFVSTVDEPSTDEIDRHTDALRASGHGDPCAIVGIGGGITLDTAKAVSNLLRNGGKAADYQGWDLVKVPGVFKIGVPTVSGTGSEATRTCVMTNASSGLKLGMNSDFTVFDHIIMDPDLTASVPRNQYFYTGADAYLHCVESLAGSYRNAIGDAYSRETIRLCREVFLSEDMKSDDNREKLMVASYLGGCAIASSYVGLVHPFSAGLSVVLGLHHCVANCVAMGAMEEFYPRQLEEFRSMVERQRVEIPHGVCKGLSDEQYGALHDATVIHSKPLTNALGADFAKILTRDRVIDLFKRM